MGVSKPFTCLPALLFVILFNLTPIAMGFGPSAAAVAEFASKPFVKRALANPSTPGAVLSFFLGFDYDDMEDAAEKLRQGDYCEEMQGYWFAGGTEYDALCHAFCPVIRECGSHQLPNEFWNTCVDGKISQLILCDQLSRNCFRGSTEAFEYDDCSLEIARSLANCNILEKQQSTLEGEFYPPYATFVCTALMHSECLDDHETCLEVLDWATEKAPHLKQWWANQRVYEMDHKKVIDEFGRYPHRNKQKGRKNTKEEEAWLADTDSLPAWAKSQL